MSEDDSLQTEIISVKARIAWLERAVETYCPEAMEMLFYTGGGAPELTAAPHPAAETTEGVEEADLQVMEWLCLADRDAPQEEVVSRRPFCGVTGGTCSFSKKPFVGRQVPCRSRSRSGSLRLRRRKSKFLPSVSVKRIRSRASCLRIAFSPLQHLSTLEDPNQEIHWSLLSWPTATLEYRRIPQRI